MGSGSASWAPRPSNRGRAPRQGNVEPPARISASIPDRAAAMKIRAYRHTHDYAEIIELWRRSGPGVQLSRSDEPDEILMKVQHDPGLFLIAEQDGKVVGTVLGGFDGRRGIVYHLAVEAAFREQGLGRRLMEEIEARLIARGCLKCYLLVADENPEAMAFYRHLGWQAMDVTLMGKELQ